MGDDRHQKGDAEHAQQHQLRQFDTEEDDRIALRADGIIDDALRQFQRDVEQGEETQGQHAEQNLLTFGLFPDEGEKRGVHNYSRAKDSGSVPRPVTRGKTGRALRAERVNKGCEIAPYPATLGKFFKTIHSFTLLSSMPGPDGWTSVAPALGWNWSGRLGPYRE